MSNKAKNPEYEILSFETKEAFHKWLDRNHKTSPGVWLKFYKKGSGVKSLVYAEALDEALCYGWIDSQVKSFDELAYLQKFTPRRTKSIWSKINTEHVQRLIDSGRMKPAGLAEVEEAKSDGRWNLAYDSSKTMEIPADLLSEIKKNKKAQSFFETLNQANLYAIGWRIQTAKKEETKEKRKTEILKMLERGEKFH